MYKMTEVSHSIMLHFTSIKLEAVTKEGLKGGKILKWHSVRWQVTKLQGATFQPLWNLDMKIIKWKVCWTISYHIKVEAITKCPDRFKNVSHLWLIHSELWMLFWHRQAAAVPGGPPAGPPERGRAQHDSHTFISFTRRLIILHSGHYLWRAARKLPLMTLFVLLRPEVLLSHLLKPMAHWYDAQNVLDQPESRQMWCDIDFLSNGPDGKFESTGWTWG